MPKRRSEGRRLVGRTEEIDRLNAALAALDDGRGQFVVVSEYVTDGAGVSVAAAIL